MPGVTTHPAERRTKRPNHPTHQLASTVPLAIAIGALCSGEQEQQGVQGLALATAMLACADATVGELPFDVLPSVGEAMAALGLLPLCRAEPYVTLRSCRRAGAARGEQRRRSKGGEEGGSRGQAGRAEQLRVFRRGPDKTVLTKI